MSFEAKYEGRCPDCGERIHVGDLVQFSTENRVEHVMCDASAGETDLDRDAKREVCQKCWLLKPCECEAS